MPLRHFARIVATLSLGLPLAAQGSDDCASAQSISGLGTYGFDNSTANTDGQPDVMCLAFGTDNIEHDVWFQWVAPSTAVATIDTCSQTFIDSKLAVYSGGCGGTILACNDDTCGLQSSISFNTLGGQAYTIRVGTFPGASGGSGTFTITDDVGGSGTGIGTNYCISIPNSLGVAAAISGYGNESVAVNDVQLRAEPVPNQPGLFYYGPTQVQVAFGNGFRCVGGTVGRLSISNAVGNVLTGNVDLNNPPNGATVITPGSTWNFQAWYRDPIGGGAAFNLSDGLSISFNP